MSVVYKLERARSQGVTNQFEEKRVFQIHQLARGSFTRVLPTHFGAASTILHAAPQTAPIFAGIQKEPAKVTHTWTLLDPFDSVRGQQLYRRGCNGPQHVIQCILTLQPFTGETLGGRHERSV